MHASLILAVVFVPLVLISVLSALLLIWLHMRHTNRKDVVDLVELQKEPQKPHAFTDINNEGSRKSTEPFPQLPFMNLQDGGGLLDPPAAAIPDNSQGQLQNDTSYSVNHSGRAASNSINTSPKRPISLTPSPSREALAAFDFCDTPSKPPIPARSLKRASRNIENPIPATATIKIEPVSPYSGPKDHGKDEKKIHSLVFEQPSLSASIPTYGISKVPQAQIDIASTASRNAHMDILAAETSANANFDVIFATLGTEGAKKENDTTNATPIPFSAVPIAHIDSPISDSLPPTPARASQMQTSIPKDAEGVKAMLANREMMAMENFRKEGGMQTKEKSLGKSMISKRNSAIREYVRNFPEQNPWRKMISKKGTRDIGMGRDAEAQQNMEG